ncbi:response regulator transcription factor [Sphingomonas sp. PAMC 26605]|uniref:response regulator transcription factor n=1 Tax=Sphingomonas sp. PAMC 26605 TaxID=1112214 RepID=UPI00055F0A2B
MRNCYIVDDDDAARTSLLTLLSARFRIVVQGFTSGDAFLRGVGDLDPGVVLLDYSMPGRNGIEVLRLLKDRHPQMVPIMLTGKGSTQAAVEAMKAGALDFLEKPSDPETLFGVIEAAFDRSGEILRSAQAAKSAAQRLARLSPQEANVLRGLVDGKRNKIIAYELGLSPRTVEIYRANVMSKLGVNSLSEALRIAYAGGWLAVERAGPA